MEASARSLGLSRVRLDAVVLILTGTAGCTDAISYLRLGHVLTANMTGNTVFFGLALGQGQGFAALRALIAVLGFVAGVAIGTRVVQHRERSASDAFRLAILLEGALLAIFPVAWNWRMFESGQAIVQALIAISAMAMGVQSAAVRNLGIPGIATTYITGTLTTLVANLVSHKRGQPFTSVAFRGAAETEDWERNLAVQAGTFLVYCAAALCVAFVQIRWASVAVFTPVIAIALVIWILLQGRKPMSRVVVPSGMHNYE